ncbi:MAG: hypothetical protein AABY64_06905 [Bdellovibrionota bacterium]
MRTTVNFIKNLNIKLFLITCLVSPRLWADPLEDQSNFESDLEVGVALNLVSQPTAMRGASVFEIPNLKASFEVTRAEGNSFQLVLRGTDNRDATSKKFQVEAQKAAVILKSFFSNSFWIEAGLIGNPWNEVSEELWDFQFWGDASFPALRRYKYLSTSELGFNAHWNINERFGLSLSAMNGESAVEAEKGPKKDIQLILWFEDETWQASAGYLQGAYDDDDTEISKKERQLFRVAYAWEPIQAAIELYKTRDSSRAIKALGIAEGLDLSSIINQSIEGQGGSFTLRWSFNDFYSLRLRADQLNPATKLDASDVKSQIVAISYEPARGTNFSLIYLRTDLGPNHSLISKTSEKAMIALGMHF